MNWKRKKPKSWRWRFALFPIRIGKKWVWLESYHISQNKNDYVCTWVTRRSKEGEEGDVIIEEIWG